jgi:chloride channel, nucleotide-sensitive, 1A
MYSKLYWIHFNEDSSSSPTGWSIDYQHLLLHAISKPSESRPYIYLQISCNKVYDIHGHEISFKSEIDDEDKFVEVNLYVREGERAVDDIFVALSECTSLHPCDDDDSDDDNYNGLESENDQFEVSENQADEPERKINKIDEERFEDAAEK